MNEKLRDAQRDIAQKLGISDEPTTEQASLISKMNETLLQKVFYLTMEKLSDDDRDILLEKIEDEKTSEEDVTAFLQSVIPDYDQFVEKIVEEFFVEMNDFIGLSDSGAQASDDSKASLE